MSPDSTPDPRGTVANSLAAETSVGTAGTPAATRVAKQVVALAR